MSMARDMMHAGAECLTEDETLSMAAQRMRDLHVGALPVCGPDDRLRGIITDRDIVVKCVARGGNPDTMTARELAAGTPVWVDAAADEDQVLELMEEHKIRRIPVIADHRLVGMISEADLAGHLDDAKLSHFVSTICTAPATN